MALAGKVLGAGRNSALLHALDARQTVASDHGRILAVRPDSDVGAVAIGEDVEDGPEVHIHAQSPKLARLEDTLPIRERFVARRPHRQIVGKDRRPLAEHDDAAALVIRGDEQPATESRFEVVQELGVLRG